MHRPRPASPLRLTDDDLAELDRLRGPLDRARAARRVWMLGIEIAQRDGEALINCPDKRPRGAKES